jgi:lipopolysaccharide transport system ATP-binding protein
VKPIIEVVGVGKRYRLGTAQGYETFREALTRSLVSGGRTLLRRRQHAEDGGGGRALWALRDVSFAVAPGEVLGVVGRNGAGKSTLLKILSQVTVPTTGRVDLYGRVGTLLEVGTGFHPELTGRENIYLNGAILGMKTSEIARQFDAIVAFAEVERFLDTAVKHYSSGMYLRLAFAVAAHLRPEILFVDEVLAVGDAQFQRKCLGKMEDVAAEGRTVVFVSHNMTAITQLCSRVIMLTDGQLVRDGKPNEIITDYLTLASDNGHERCWPDPVTAPGNDKVRLRAVRIVSNRPGGEVDIDREVTVEVEFEILAAGSRSLCVNIYLLDALGTTVLSTANIPSASSEPDGWFYETHRPGRYRAQCRLPANFLNEGRYYISVYLVTADTVTIEAQAIQVVSFNVFDTGVMRADGNNSDWHGVVRVRLPWRTDLIEPTCARRDCGRD